MTNQTLRKFCLALISTILFMGFCGCRKNTPAPSPEAINAFMGAAFNGNEDTVSKAIEGGIDVNLVDKNGNTPLMLAAFNGHTKVAETLLKAKADVNLRNPDGRTALMFACTINSPALVELLIKNGADVNTVDGGEQWSPLMFAAAEGHAAVVDILLANKADPKWVDKDGDTATDFATRRGHPKLAKKLQSLLD